DAARSARDARGDARDRAVDPRRQGRHAAIGRVMRLFRLPSSAFLLCCALAPGFACAQQAYPAKTVRMIVAYPPGGGTDIVGRMVAQKLSESFKQQVVVDNRGGATGNIGTELAARAAPDGYTLLMGNVAPNAINVSLFAKLPYDPVSDFAP